MKPPIERVLAKRPQRRENKIEQLLWRPALLRRIAAVSFEREVSDLFVSMSRGCFQRSWQGPAGSMPPRDIRDVVLRADVVCPSRRFIQKVDDKSEMNSKRLDDGIVDNGVTRGVAQSRRSLSHHPDLVEEMLPREATQSLIARLLSRHHGIMSVDLSSIGPWRRTQLTRSPIGGLLPRQRPENVDAALKSMHPQNSECFLYTVRRNTGHF